MPARAKEFAFTVDLTEGEVLRTETGSALDDGAEWSPEHLLLAALVRCSLKSLRYHADRAGVDVLAATGSASTRVTKREDDGRYAIVEAEVALDVSLRSVPEPEALAQLLAKAERDCFIGASLRIAPRYVWTVSG